MNFKALIEEIFYPIINPVEMLWNMWFLTFSVIEHSGEGPKGPRIQ